MDNLSRFGRQLRPMRSAFQKLGWDIKRFRFVDGEGEEGSGAGTDWKSTVEEGLRTHPSLEKFKEPGEVFKSYVELEKLVGAKGVILPGEKATPEEIDKFYNALGRPEKPEGYKLSALEKLHPELKITPESETGFKTLAHKHGLTTKQADGLYKDFYTMSSSVLTKRDEQMSTAKHEAETKLRTDWGADYDKNLSSAKRLIEKFGGANAREAFGELGNNPQVLKTIANIAKQFSEDGFIKGNAVRSSEVTDAQKAITDIMLNQKHPYWVAGPGHTEAVEEMKRLQSIVHPEVEA